MSTNDPQHPLDALQAQLKKAKDEAKTLSLTRLVLFALIVVLVYFWLSDNRPAFGIISGFFTFVFFILIFIHAGKLKLIKFITDRITLNEESLNRRSTRKGSREAEEPHSDLNSYYEAKGTYSDHESERVLDESVVDDLQILEGARTLFGFLDVSSTAFGATRLHHLLLNPLKNEGVIRERQQSVISLSQNESLIRKILEHLVGLRSFSGLQVAQDLKQPCHFSRRPLLTLVSHLLGCLTPITLGAAFFDTRAWPITTILLIINIGIIGLQAKKANFSRQRLLHLGPWLERIPGLYALLKSEELKGKPIQQIQTHLQKFELPSQRLNKSISRLGLHSMGPLYELINLITLWELQILPHAERKLELYLDELNHALTALGETEALTSLALPLIEQPDFTMPEVKEQSLPFIKAKQLAHPLLDYEGLVRNDVHLGDSDRIWIITGSNMAGKSTFLKAIGTNLVLAHAGGPVCSEELSWTPLELLSDINIRDSLDDGKSYFQVEVERVLRMVQASKESPKVLAILDELFRGTNSAERLAISRSILRNLRDCQVLSLVATHDGQLTHLVTELKEEGMTNYHFREHVQEDTMTFDYLLRSGPAQSRNALKVLEVSGYPKEITSPARKELSEPES